MSPGPRPAPEPGGTGRRLTEGAPSEHDVDHHLRSATPMFMGINHIALTVTDLDVSQRFYSDVLGFLPVLDVGDGRVLMHNPSGFTIGLRRPPQGDRRPFSEANTGLDHVGLAAADRDELVAWERRLQAAGVECSPLQDTPLGHHLNFRDPDGIALELQAPNASYAAALAHLRTGAMSDAEVLALAEQLIGAALVAHPADPDADPGAGPA